MVDLGPNKGRGGFLNLSGASPYEIVKYIFLAVNANPTPLDWVIGVYLGQNALAVPIGQGGMLLASH